MDPTEAFLGLGCVSIIEAPISGFRVWSLNLMLDSFALPTTTLISPILLSLSAVFWTTKIRYDPSQLYTVFAPASHRPSNLVSHSLLLLTPARFDTESELTEEAFLTSRKFNEPFPRLGAGWEFRRGQNLLVSKFGFP